MGGVTDDSLANVMLKDGPVCKQLTLVDPDFLRHLDGARSRMVFTTEEDLPLERAGRHLPSPVWPQLSNRTRLL
jgi:hypothetical protein